MLNNLKMLLGISSDNTDRDELLKLLISLATQRLRRKLKGNEPPDELNYIIVDVVAARFNRIGSEGLSSHSVEGESCSFTDDDFAAFDDDIQEYLNSLNGSTSGKVRFL
jgi:hypothetical protein